MVRIEAYPFHHIQASKFCRSPAVLKNCTMVEGRKTVIFCFKAHLSGTQRNLEPNQLAIGIVFFWAKIKQYLWAHVLILLLYPISSWSILIGILKITSMNQHDQMLYVSPHRDFLFCPSLSLMQACLVTKYRPLDDYSCYFLARSLGTWGRYPIWPAYFLDGVETWNHQPTRDMTPSNFSRVPEAIPKRKKNREKWSVVPFALMTWTRCLMSCSALTCFFKQ